ncbi:MAG: DUF1450 domain-containing protein [Sporolactobacillus sp.]
MSAMGLILIETCSYNQVNAEDLAALERQPEVAIMDCECLNACGMCSLRPFVCMNGARLCADTKDALLAKLQDKVAAILRNQ